MMKRARGIIGIIAICTGMLIIPFMSCSARLPVYILIIGVTFPKYPSLILFLIYILGIAVAILVAKLFKKTIFRSMEAPFVMELPPYRIPTIKTTFRHMWNKGVQYLKKMGGVILIASILIWFLSSYPKNIELSKNYDAEMVKVENGYNKLLKENYGNPDKVNEIKTEKDGLLYELTVEKESERHIKSYIGRVGKFIEPVIKPLGFDWKMGISLLTGIAAKEVVVSTMGVLYHAKGDVDKSNETLKRILRNHTYKDGENAGRKVFSPLVSISFLIFVLIYFPCIAVLAAIKNETGSWKWAIFAVFYTTFLAWLLSYIVFQTGSLIIS